MFGFFRNDVIKHSKILMFLCKNEVLKNLIFGLGATAKLDCSVERLGAI